MFVHSLRITSERLNTQVLRVHATPMRDGGAGPNYSLYAMRMHPAGSMVPRAQLAWPGIRTLKRAYLKTLGAVLPCCKKNRERRICEPDPFP